MSSLVLATPTAADTPAVSISTPLDSTTTVSIEMPSPLLHSGPVSNDPRWLGPDRDWAPLYSAYDYCAFSRIPFLVKACQDDAFFKATHYSQEA